MSINSIEHYWQHVRSRARLEDVRHHDLRHGYGTAAGHAGANALLVRDALGHKTLAMTGRYVNKAGKAVYKLANGVAARLDGLWSGKP
jgi:integrase